MVAVGAGDERAPAAHVQGGSQYERSCIDQRPRAAYVLLRGSRRGYARRASDRESQAVANASGGVTAPGTRKRRICGAFGSSNGAGAKGLEPPTPGFGDRCSTN